MRDMNARGLCYNEKAVEELAKRFVLDVTEEYDWSLIERTLNSNSDVMQEYSDIITNKGLDADKLTGELSKIRASAVVAVIDGLFQQVVPANFSKGY